MYRDFTNHQILACAMLLAAVVTLPALHAQTDESLDTPQKAKIDHEAAVAKLLQQYCAECHGADTQEGNIRLDTLDFAQGQPGAEKRLERMLDAVSSSTMPPQDADMPNAREHATLVSWLEDRLTTLAKSARSTGNRTRNRRLTVEEYNFTMRELFGVDAKFDDLLPADPISESGYRNESERLGFSSLQIEAYLDAARRAVERYVQFGKIDQQPVRYHIELEDLFYSTGNRYATRERAPEPIDAATFATRRTANLASPPEYVDALGPKLPGAFSDDESMRAAIPKLNQQYIAIPKRYPVGEMIIRVRASGTAGRDGRFPRMRVEAGITLGDGCSIDKRVVGETDVAAPVDRPSTYEFRIRLEDVPTKGPLSNEDSFDRLSVFDMDQIFISNISCDRKAIFALGRGGYSDPAEGSQRILGKLDQMAADGANFLHLDCIEIEMMPGVGKDNGPYRWRVGLGRPGEEGTIAGKFLGQFMRHAFRRPVAASEIAAKLELFNTLRGGGYTFETSLRETSAAVLVSPSFLFLESGPTARATQSPETPSPHQLAARLSYLLWLSPADEQLMKCADNGSIVQQSVLRREAKRLLADPRSHRFLESFCRQWLRLDKHANVAIDRQTYPTWDDDLATVSIRETLAYFVEVFATNANALDLIDSNYAILNDRLAEHYDITQVTTGDLHKIVLPKHSVRGGLLTQASLMTMNSDGVDSHPIRRGVWLLDRLLNSPPPPPPANVPDIDDDPNFRGLSLKERIELHSQSDACKKCHEKIDPWGIPFENLDATGRWRDKVAIHESGKVRSRPVDATTSLPGGEQINNIVELKRYLRERRGKQFANSLVHHMLTFAIGRPPNYADRSEVEEIQTQFAESDYRLRDLVLAIVESQLFQQK